MKYVTYNKKNKKILNVEIDNTHTHTHARTHTHAHVRVMTTCSIHFNRSIFGIEIILILGKNGGLYIVYV